MTRREFSLALAHKACLLVRRSGSQLHLIMAIAHSTHVIAHGMAIHSPTVYISHFSRFSVFLVIFYVLPSLFLIFLVCQFSRHSLFPTVIGNCYMVIYKL